MKAKNVLDIFEKIDTEEKAYWLGFLYADGSVGSKENKIELGLAEKDLKQIEKFKTFLKINNKISYRESSKSYRISFRSDKCKQDLINLGCVPKKSLILTFPSEEQVPNNLIKHFIRGYFDGDGHIPKDKYSRDAQFISTRSFCEYVQKYLKELLDINSVVTLNIKDKNSPRYNGVTCTWRIKDKKSSKKFYDYIYKDANMYLKRKYEVYSSKTF